MRVDPRLLEILVCPRTKTSLIYDEARQELISRAARLAYPIRDGIPHAGGGGPRTRRRGAARARQALAAWRATCALR